MNKLVSVVAQQVLAEFIRFLDGPSFASAKLPAKQSGREREPSFTKRDAYIWMLARAIKRDGPMCNNSRPSKNYVLNVGPCEFSRARSELAKAWNWSERAVGLFLDDLKGCGEIDFIRPVSDTGRDLSAERVPMSYRLNRLFNAFRDAQAGVLAGVGL